MISMDDAGMIEFWSGAKKDYEFPTNLRWESKLDTDFFEFLKVLSSSDLF